MRTEHWMKGFCVGAVVAGLVLSSPAVADNLTVVAWGGAGQAALKKVYFDPFGRSKAIQVLEDSWDGGVGVLRAKVQAAQPSWDVVEVETDELILGCEEGLYQKIDWAKLGGRDAYIPAALHDCGVGMLVWSTVLGYDADKLKEAPRSWADFWNVAKYPGKRGLRAGPKYSLEFALIADGVPVGDVYKELRQPAGIDRAFRKLDEIKPHVVWWRAGAQPAQLLASGEVVMTSIYNGRLTAAAQENKRNFKITWSGNIYATDFWVVLANSPRKDLAMDFIAYASRAENQIKIPELVVYGLTNKKAIATVDPKLAPDLPTSPENISGALPLDAGFWVEHVDRLTERFNAWATK